MSTWSDGTSSPDVYTSVRAFRSAKRQEMTGKEFTGAPVLDSTYRPVPALLAAVATTAQPLVGTIAALTGEPSGARHLGAWLPDAPLPGDLPALPPVTPRGGTVTATATPATTAPATPTVVPRTAPAPTTTSLATPTPAPRTTAAPRATSPAPASTVGTSTPARCAWGHIDRD